MPEGVSVVQAPVLYVPDLVELTVDGRMVPYRGVPHDQYVFGVPGSAGTHAISIRFSGFGWPNALSIRGRRVLARPARPPDGCAP